MIVHGSEIVLDTSLPHTNYMFLRVFYWIFISCISFYSLVHVLFALSDMTRDAIWASFLGAEGGRHGLFPIVSFVLSLLNLDFSDVYVWFFCVLLF